MRIPSNKIKDIIHYFRNELNGLYEEVEIETFIAYCFEEFLAIKRHEIIFKGNDTISESELLKINFAIKGLKLSKPIQYILGSADFYGLKLRVNEHTLIPRPETEELVDVIIKDYTYIKVKNQELRIESDDCSISKQQNYLLDIGTGSGCIAIALKKNIPEANVFAMDISENALTVARNNADLNEVSVQFIQQNILSDSSFEHALDIIVSNPPYVRESEKGEMQPNVLNYEPHNALFVTNEEPLVFYIAIAEFAKKHLKVGGMLYFEINENLGNETSDMLLNKGFKNISIIKDLSGKNRILRCNS